jgi:uncharacterized membrane protein
MNWVPSNGWQIVGLIVLAIVAVYLFQNILLPIISRIT